MITISRVFNFCSSHTLSNHTGLCKNLHGHNYKLIVEVERHDNTEYKACEKGMVIDFSRLDSLLEPIIKTLDHTHLNDLEEFPLNYPTAENIIRYIRNKLLKRISTFCPEIKIVSITLYETERSFAKWTV